MLRRALCLTFFIGLAACGPSAKAPAPKQDAASTEAIVVTSAKVERTEVATPITGSGNVTPVRMTDIGPSVDGIIAEVMVNVGETVKKDQPLCRTRDVDIRLQVQEMARQVALARAQHANAEADLRRQDALKAGGWVSASNLDAMRTNAEVTRA